ncbi:MAG: excinuclease ABC subunit B [Deltaproteobacteria bacterium RIFOXYA12_FULL_61_11]|nr:MAG: excinuclease ABC subunit B [Deltaproteobacteria bacterium RIFOXYA12_FULL_61_11]
MTEFELVTDFVPRGDQPQAIAELCEGIAAGERHQVLLGVTGSGKTFTMANVIAATSRPALVLAPNKTLAAQLYAEFKELFPHNAVEYFVSYYDYYQPEAYLPTTDTYIEKDSAINDEIDKLRHSATRSLLTRHDVVVVASVSCIYGLGSPANYRDLHLFLQTGQELDRREILAQLVAIQYERNDFDLGRGTFRVRGEILEIFPAYEEKYALRVEFLGDEIEAMTLFDPLTGRRVQPLSTAAIYPASHYVVAREKLEKALLVIEHDLEVRLCEFEKAGKVVERQRLEQRTRYDLEMLAETGYCTGIENYSRYLDGRAPGEPPYTLLDYFPEDFLLFVDESHISVPQVQAMFRGDQARKDNLVEFGFRLPAARDNRPLTFEEFEQRIGQAVFVSATPAEYEMRKSCRIVEQIIRPTGLVDPEVQVRPAEHQVDDLLSEIRKRVLRSQRVLVTTLTKRMAEDLTDYLAGVGIKVRYLHSDVETLDRIELIRDLRRGDFDVLVGINLLREGLDLPEVALVAVLDADKEGFLRSERSLVQTFGRAARNLEGTVLLYADRITDSMRRAMEETSRRRELQVLYNQEHGITPTTVQKNLSSAWGALLEREHFGVPEVGEELAGYRSEKEAAAAVARLEKEMRKAAKNLEFERAASLRDQLAEIRRGLL